MSINTCMKTQDEITRQQRKVWNTKRALAAYRKEPWSISFEQFQQLWKDHWQSRGRASDSYTMSRLDPSQPWTLENVEIQQRSVVLARNNHRRAVKNWLKKQQREEQ